MTKTAMLHPAAEWWRFNPSIGSSGGRSVCRDCEAVALAATLAKSDDGPGLIQEVLSIRHAPGCPAGLRWAAELSALGLLP